MVTVYNSVNKSLIVYPVCIMTILDQLAVQILREFGISSFSPGISGFAFFFTGSRDQNPSYPPHSMSKFLVICDGAVYQNFQCSAFYFFCFALLFYLCALFCALLCCVFMFHCIMYYLLCNLIVHA